jgi:hypothetical protein
VSHTKEKERSATCYHAQVHNQRSRIDKTSKPVDLDEVLLGDVVGHQECGHVLPLVTLELDDFSKLRVLYKRTIAAKL